MKILNSKNVLITISKKVNNDETNICNINVLVFFLLIRSEHLINLSEYKILANIIIVQWKNIRLKINIKKNNLSLHHSVLKKYV